MTKYVAFLRGINVGGKKLIKMTDLAGVFTSLGLQDVRTYIQSGNVIFDSTDTDANALSNKIEKKIHKSFGHEVPVLLRTLAELEAILKHNPFRKIRPDDDVVTFVTFLSAEPVDKVKLPLMFTTENFEVFAIKDRTAFILCHRKKNGLFGFPNNFIEKKLGVSATTRTWATVNKIVALTRTQS